jgi:hypothetical protein
MAATTTASSTAITTTTQIHSGPAIAPLLRLLAACRRDRATPAMRWPRPLLPMRTGGRPAWPPPARRQLEGYSPVWSGAGTGPRLRRRVREPCARTRTGRLPAGRAATSPPARSRVAARS